MKRPTDNTENAIEWSKRNGGYPTEPIASPNNAETEDYEARVMRLNRCAWRAIFEGSRDALAIIGLVALVVATLIRIKSGAL